VGEAEIIYNNKYVNFKVVDISPGFDISFKLPTLLNRCFIYYCLKNDCKMILAKICVANWTE
jgi:hypothetical protein